jgi:hypothetical protein
MRKPIRAITAALLLATLSLSANAAVFVSVNIGPPVLPVYVPPPIPGPGYLWVPGYWAWGGGDYYWVPGTWALAPTPGLLWTPGYWGWGGGVYVWHMGYWGPHVGFYGGINYGFGYGGVGYRGGYWRGGTFVVNTTVINEAPVNRVAFNGGAGGIAATPTAAEVRATREQHMGMSQAQVQHEQAASRDNTMRASFNHGRPPVAATQKPGVFYGKGVVAARAGGGQGSAGMTGTSAGRPPQGQRPVMNEQSGGRGGAAQPSRPAYPGGERGGYQGGPHGPPPANARPQSQGRGGERPEHGGERGGRPE